jgi:hypothetical protein
MAQQWLKWSRPATRVWNTQPRFAAKLHAEFAESAKLEATIRANLKSMRFLS